MVVIWGTFGVFITMFYNSNLRANLIAVDFEPNIDTIEEVINKCGTVYVPTHAAQFM